MDDISHEMDIAVLPPPDDLHCLFPVTAQSGWTTARRHFTPNNIHQLALSDSQLGVHRISSGTTHNIRRLSGSSATAWEAVYKKGSFRPSGDVKGGFGFYLKGPPGLWDEDLQRSAEVVYSYAVRFQKDFDFGKGGKLPGIFGGEGEKAYHCTGGRQDDRCSCFDLRLMWRSDGQGELYAYIPFMGPNNSRLLAVPGSHQNPDHGISVGRGSFNFTRAAWTSVAERVKLNDPGHENGEIQLWINGDSVIHVTGLVLRDTLQAGVQGLHFQTFFGGSTSDWASPKEQCAWFSNVSGAIIS